MRVVDRFYVHHECCDSTETVTITTTGGHYTPATAPECPQSGSELYFKGFAIHEENDQ